MTDTGRRALVTGGAGFIGSHLVDRLLLDGYAVCVVDDLSSGSASNLPAGARFERADICDVDALRQIVAGFRPEVVFHAAAQTDVRRSIREPDFDARVNVLGALNVLRAAVAAGARRIVYASSAAVYGDPERLPVSERDATRPISEYGASKLAFEHYLSAHGARGLIEYAALRYANVYGPRQRGDGEAGVVAIFTQRMLGGEPVTIPRRGHVFQRPRVKSGNSAGRLPFATDHSDSGVTALMATASYTFMSVGRPSRRHLMSR